MSYKYIDRLFNRVRKHRKSARDTPDIRGIARTFLMKMHLIRAMLLADCCDAWELLALEVLEHCATTCRYVAYLVSITHLCYSCN